MERSDAPRRRPSRWLFLERQDLPQSLQDCARHHRYPLERPKVFRAARESAGQNGREAATMKTERSKQVRCAIYTRVSTDQGLEQDFNSLDAQYDASQAYIRSQAHAGWAMVRSKYDDGGFSGGNT